MTSTDDRNSYSARLSEDGLRILCGASTCDQPIASVVTRRVRNHVYRELCLLPGWEGHPDGIDRPSDRVCKRVLLGYGPGYRRTPRVSLNTVDQYVGEPGKERLLKRFFARGPGDHTLDGKPDAPREKKLQLGVIVTDFSEPVAVECCKGHRNILDAERLNVVTGDERKRLFGLRE